MAGAGVKKDGQLGTGVESLLESAPVLARDLTSAVAVTSGWHHSLALLSDGLQMLALNYGTKAAHQPFFAPMFASLRKADDAQELLVPLKQFLDSKAVNDRTDDDKTLVLATRVVANGDAAV